jgi:hypothetical protein
VQDLLAGAGMPGVEARLAHELGRDRARPDVFEGRPSPALHGSDARPCHFVPLRHRGDDGAVAREVEVQERPALVPEGGGGDRRVHQTHHRKAGRPRDAQQERERGRAPETGHGQEGLRGLVARCGPDGEELRVGEVRAADPLREGQAGGRGVEGIPIRVVHEARLETCFRCGLRSHEQAAAVEQGQPRARGQGMGGPGAEGHQADVVHLDGERAHRIRPPPGCG